MNSKKFRYDNNLNYEKELLELLNIQCTDEIANYVLFIIEWRIRDYPRDQRHKDGNFITRKKQRELLNRILRHIDQLQNDFDQLFDWIESDHDFIPTRNFLKYKSDYPAYESLPENLYDKYPVSHEEYFLRNKMKWAYETHYSKGHSILNGLEKLNKLLSHTKKHILNTKKNVCKTPTKKAYYEMIIELVAIFNQFNRWDNTDDNRYNKEQFLRYCLVEAFELGFISKADTNITSRMINEAEKDGYNVEFRIDLESDAPISYSSSLSVNLKLRKN